MEAVKTQDDKQDERQKFTFIVDDREFVTEKLSLTGGEIMDIVEIVHSQGLVLLNEDGTQTKVEVIDVIEFKEILRFKKKPRFKRGRHE